MLEKFTDRARKVTVHATQIAAASGDGSVEPAHLILAMIKHDRPVADALQAAGADTQMLAEMLSPKRQTQQGETPTLSPETAEVLRSSTEIAEEMGQSLVVPLHIAAALIRSGVVTKQLIAAGLDVSDFETKAQDRMPTTREVEARCSRCGASTDEYGKVKELSLDVEGGKRIHLYAYYCGRCGSTYGLVKG